MEISKKINFYNEDQNHIMPHKFLTEEMYAEAIAAFPVFCADVVVVNKRRKTFFLAQRIHKPMPGWWWIGGRSMAGEIPSASIKRCFKRETSLDVSEEKFKFVCMNRYFWKDRQQEPQDIGCDSLAYMFYLELSDEEFSKIILESHEYGLSTLQEFDKDALVKEKVHPAIFDIYQEIFSNVQR